MEQILTQAGMIFLPELQIMDQFRYYKRTFLSPPASDTTSYIVARVESSREGTYAFGTNLLDIADCDRRISIEFFLGNPLARRRSLAKARLLINVITTFYESLVQESKLIEAIQPAGLKASNIQTSLKNDHNDG
jgi:hypothetical protein